MTQSPKGTLQLARKELRNFALELPLVVPLCESRQIDLGSRGQFGISGCEQDREIGPNLPQRHGELSAIHPGHRIVRVDEIEVLAAMDDLQCLVSRVRLPDGMAEILKQIDCTHRDQRVVVDDEDGAPRHSGSRALFGHRGRRSRHVLCRRPQELGAGSVSGRAANAQGAVQLDRETMDHRQPEACPLAQFLGRKERLGRLGERLRIHAHAVVRYRDADISSGRQLLATLQLQPFRGDRDAAAIGQGVTRVDDKIEEREFDLVRVDEGER